MEVVNNIGAAPFFENRAFPEFVGMAVGLPAALELYGMRKTENENGNDYADDDFPGNLGIDPLHLYPAEKEGQRGMQFAEITMGRLCMLAAAVVMTKDVLSFLGFEADSLLSFISVLQATQGVAGDMTI